MNLLFGNLRFNEFSRGTKMYRLRQYINVGTIIKAMANEIIGVITIILTWRFNHG